MGDAVSIRFVLRGQEARASQSPYLRSHWGGDGFRDFARDYARRLVAGRKGQKLPLDRHEPQTVIVDFVRAVLADQRLDVVERDLLLGAGDPAREDSRHFDVVLPGPGGRPEEVQVLGPGDDEPEVDEA